MRRVATWVKRLVRWSAATVAAGALLLAIGIGAFRLAIELLPGYQQRIIDRVREETGLTLEFDSVYARIGRYGPEIAFRGARLLPAGGEEPLLSAESGRVSLSLFRSAWYRRLEIGRVLLERPRLNFVIHADGGVQLVGQGALQRQAPAERRPMTLERLPRGRFAVRDATLAVLDLRAKQGRFELTGADIEMVRRGNEVSVNGQVKLPEHLGASIDFRADAEGDLADSETVEWTVGLDAYDLDLEQWAALLPDSFFVPAAGYGSVEMSARGRGRRLETLRARPVFEDLRLPGAEQPFTRIAGDIRVRQDGDVLTVEATGLELSRPGSPWRPTSVEARLTRKDGRLATATLRADYLKLENLAAFSPVLPAGRPRELLEALAPRGELFGIDLGIAHAGAKRLPDVTGRLRFVDVAFEPLGRAAGLSGLDGAIEGRGAGGVVHIATRDGLIKWPLQWRSLVEVPRADARVEWSRFDDGVRFWVEGAKLDTGHGRAEGRLRMVVRPGQLPLMDLQATASDFDLRQTWRYLQIERLKPKTLAWLDAAFRAGRVPEARVSITGPTRGFPYREGQGRFTANGRVTGLQLYYAPGWPDLRGVEAEFNFDGPGLHGVATRGNLSGIAFSRAEVHSTDLRNAMLIVSATGRADAGRAIRMLQASPLAPSLGAGFAGLAGSGPVTGEISMFLPVKDLDRRVIAVVTRLGGVTLRHQQEAVEATGLEGDLWFRNREIHAPALRGKFLGGPLQVTIATEGRRDGTLETQVNAQGTADGALLVPAAHLPLNANLNGRADWRGFLTVHRAAAVGEPARGTMRLSSDLRGLSLGLPEPFEKSVEVARPLTITGSFDGDSGLRMQGQYGRDVHALLQWRRGGDGPPVERGVVSFGTAVPGSLPKEPGLWLRGRLDEASVSAILALRWSEPRGRPLAEWLGGADLAVRDLEVLGYRFANVNARLRPGNRAWDIHVDGPAASGQLTVPYDFPGEVPMVLDLDRLEFGEPMRMPTSMPAPANGAAGASRGPDPRELPAIRVDLRDFRFGGRSFGHTQAEFSRGTAGMTLNQFSMKHAAFEAKGRGSWLVRERGAECRLEFEADSTDVLGFMNAMQLGSLVAASQGRVSASLSWPGPPETSAIERLSGRIEISARDGRLTSVEPGAGRVFGLMSLAHLPRRLALDFGDLTGEGLAFDAMTGSFQLTDGEAYTDNLTLRGSAAEIGLAGRTSLRHRTYDQTAVVTGQLGASLGVAGALAGGPAVGAALLLFSQIFKQPLKGATRGYYRITGTWDEPQVKRVDAREVKDSRQAGSAAPEAAESAGGAPQPP
ncbi:MAG: YhdP family protein [Gammaproteobacteria bacterium]